MRSAALTAVAGILLLATGCGKEAKPVGQKPLPVPAGTERTPKNGPPPIAKDDAAAQYLLACKALPSETPDDKLGFFLRTTLQGAPPEVLERYPEAKAAIGSYEEAVRVMHRGAAMRTCDFQRDRPDRGPFSRRGTENLIALRDLSRKVVAYGKLLESQGRSAEAVGVYLDIVRMGNHLGHNADSMQLMLGVSVSGVGMAKIQSMLSRGADEKVTRAILDGLSAMPECAFSLSRAIDMDRLALTGWLEGNIKDDFAGEGSETIRRAWDAGKFREVIELIGAGKLPDSVQPPTDREGVKGLLKAWLAEYDAERQRLPKTADGPYPVVYPEIVKVEKEIEETCAKTGNRLLIYVTPLSAMKRSVTGNEACLGATRLLAAACLSRAADGKYPDSIEGLRRHFPGGLPKDPFSGKDHLYRLEGGLPAVEANVEDAEYRKAHPVDCVFRLGEVRKREAEHMRNWPADWEKNQKADVEAEEKAPAVSAPPRR